MVSLLKSSSEQGTFKQALEAPVSGWHIVTGHPKPHEKRVRRQVSNLFPTPVLTGASPTPSTTMAPPSTAPSRTVIVPTTTRSPNTVPEIQNPIGLEPFYIGRAFRYQIPAGTFYDREDGNTRNLRLEMRMGSLGQLPSWIMFDSLSQVIYALPLGSNSIGWYEFVLSATDKGGKTVSDRFKVQASDRSTSFTRMFTICLNYDYKKFKNDVRIQLQLMRKITNYYGLDLSQLHLASYTYKRGAIFFAFKFVLSDQNCNSKTLENLIDGFGRNNRELNPNFQTYLLPEFDVLYGFHEGIGPCTPINATKSVPEVNRKIDQLSVSLGQGMHFIIPWNTFYDQQDFYTHNLKLEIRTNNGEALSATSWIGFNSSEQEIYAQPNALNIVGHHKFRIVAIDSGGLETFTNLKVHVVDDTNRYNHEFSLLLPSIDSYEDLAENTINRVLLLEAIAKYYQLNVTSVRIAKYLEVSFHFRFDSIPYEECDNPLLKRIIDGFWIDDQKEVNKSFLNALRKDNINVLTGYYFGIGPCEGITPKLDSSPKGERQSIEVFRGQAIIFHVPYDTFYDDLEFYTPNLRLSIKTTENKELPPPFWIFLDPIQVIYGLPLDISTVGRNKFHLVARNRQGKEGSTTLRVTVREENVNYENMFAIRIENYNAIKRDVYQRVKLIDKIASYYDLDYKNVRVFSQNPDTFTFGFDTIPAGPCDDQNLLKVKNGFWSDRNVNPKFVEALSPDFNVISGYYNICGETVNNPPVTINPTKRQTVYEGQVMKFPIPRDTFRDEEDGYTPQLNLVMTKMNGENLLPTSWFFFDSPQQEILSLPIGNNELGMHRFRLTAADKEGFTASDDFEVMVLEDTNTYNHEFTIDAAVEDSVKSRVIFVETLANYFGVDFRDVRVRSYGSDVETVFQFAIRNLTCDYLRLLKSSFIMNKKLNENFINALHPEFVVSSGSYKGQNICPPFEPTPKNNTPPQLFNHIDRLDVFQGQGLRFHIPYDTFYDQEDFYTPNLKLEMRTIDRDKLLRTSWILFNSSRQEIYGLPSDVNRIGIHEFLMVAADKKGSKAYDAFEVSVLEDNIPYSHKFNILIDYDNVTFMENVGIRVLLLNKIASYCGVNFTTVRVISYTPGVVFTFYFDFLPYEECSHPNLEKLIDGFWFGDNLNPEFIAALAPDFRVISGSYEMLSPCKVIPPSVAGLVADRPGGIWWTYAIIPAIVLAIVLLLIGCCVLILMGCCRKQKMTGAEKTTFIYKRKPVVLQEEYEIKEKLLKQPIVLPNEKPPVPPVYPRSPVLGGDRTPLLIEEAKSVPYQAPTFMSSRQMASGGGGSSNVAFAGGNGGGAGGSGGGGGVGGSGGGGGVGSGLAGGSSAASGSGATVAGAGVGSFSGAGGGAFGGGAGSGGGSSGSGALGGSSGGGTAGAGGGVSGGAGGTAVSFSMASGGGGASFKQTSYSYSYSSSGGSVSGGSRKAAYSGYRLPPAYVPP